MSDNHILVRPSTPLTPSIARISFNGDALRVYFPEPKTAFNNIVKMMDYQWQRPYWVRTIPQELHATRAAELASTLLAAGYCVKGPREVMETAVAQSFEPEPVRTIHRRADGNYDGWFAIWWHKERGGDLNEARRGLSGSRWSDGRLMVPPEQFESVLDFATQYDCHLSPGALALAEEARAEQDAAIVVDLSPVDAPELPPVNGRKPPTLPVPEFVELNDDLLDDN